jgi:hypothetical protein
MKKIRVFIGLLVLCLAGVAYSHEGAHVSIHDVVAGFVDRLGRTLPESELRALDVRRAFTLLTSEERDALGSQHIRFNVNVPVVVTVLVDSRLVDETFWLNERGFRPTTEVVEYEKLRFLAWERQFPAGEVGLGVNSLSGGGEHYLVLVRPTQPGASLAITDFYPGQLRETDFADGAKPYADRDEELGKVPKAFAGCRFVRTLRSSREDAKVVGVFRWTEHPSSDRPDSIVLTWSGDPRRTQTIQWRTSSRVRKGAVLYGRRADLKTPHPRKLAESKAVSEVLRDPRLLNDAEVIRHTVELRNLEPGTAYVYAVGDGSREGWGEFQEFTTAPESPGPFSFIYMGDAQNGLDRWGSLVQAAFRDRPDAAFYLLAGDLVNRGNQREDWDSLFHNARGVLDHRPLVPVIGNHECQGGKPTLFLKQFTLPRNGPEGLEPERAYTFNYRQAQFIVLDSNLDPEAQAPWLERQLAGSTSTWKFVTYHHPAYSSVAGRNNKDVRKHWTPLFDKYHVDLVLQGHDHAYLRTYPMKKGKRVASPAEGTVYLVSVSGTKMYPQGQHDYTEVGITNVSTYQVIDIQVSGDRLLYRAFDGDGSVRDNFVIEKRAPSN